MSALPDIRVGDLVKATRKGNPETTITGRVREVIGSAVELPFHCAYHRNWDFEVLDRPLPPISAELLSGAVEAYLEAAVEAHPLGSLARKGQPAYYEHAVSAVINYLREHDTYNKESK